MPGNSSVAATGAVRQVVIDNLPNLIVEVSGEARKDKAATARTLWIPAINNHGAYGRWNFIEIGDPWDAKNTIRAAIASNFTPSKG